MDVKIESGWNSRLKDEFEKPYFKKLTEFVKSEYSKKTIFPPGGLIFNAFDLCPFDKVKAVIIGQDPYHGPGQAHGLCFSVRDGIEIPPSLRNIYKEIENDLGIKPSYSGNLERWASQGVLLLNATLTVESHRAGSHQGKGWEQFTDSVIYLLNKEKDHLVFFLWGAYAQRKGIVIERGNHLVLESVQPFTFIGLKGFFRKQTLQQMQRLP